MSGTYDAIVIGLGAMGSATLSHLAKEGVKVLGIDQYRPPHDHGSSHGKSRVIREAYFEHPSYVPLVQRAYELWADLETESGQKLFTQTGGLMMGRADSALVKGAKLSADTHNLPYEWLTADDIRAHYPIFNIKDEIVAVLEPRAGILSPEKCIEAYLKLAEQRGAETRYSEAVSSWDFRDGQYEVETSSGRFTTRQFIITAGAWVGALIPDLERLFKVERQLLFWFEPARDREQFSAENLPIFALEYEAGAFMYGFPDMGDGFKVAKHYAGSPCDPDNLDRAVNADEIAEMKALLSAHIPSGAGKLQATAVCMYTNTPDLHFIIDEHPKYKGLWVVSPCSGHGFKMASAIGEIVAQRVSSQSIAFDLSLFQLARFGESNT